MNWSADDPSTLAVVVILLVSPILLVVPTQRLWKKRVLKSDKHKKYRKIVNGILTHGYPLQIFRASLDKTARSFQLDDKEQGLVESDILYPLNTMHFLILPSMILWPLLSIFAVFLILPLIPLLRLTEWIMIDKGLLAWIVKVIKNYTNWQLIGVPKLSRDARKGDVWIQALHRMPTTVFLGLFAYLVVHYLSLPDIFALGLAGIIYLLLASLAIITSVAIDGELAFADNAQRRIMPLEAILQDLLTPIVGLGLLVLIVRQVFFTITYPGVGLHDPIIFAISIMVVLYTATIVGALIEWAAGRRGKIIRNSFHKRLIDDENPELYSFTRNKDGSLNLRKICMLEEFFVNGHRFPEQSLEASIRFEDLMALPSLVEEGVITLPPKKPERKPEKIEVSEELPNEETTEEE
ncbi:MAG TPA: hypothetical protein EYN58_02945 [Candidatus Poseidoniales archaeon]|nr:MAG: hypothetical protein CXX81_26325 [Euryarchaeota archaeon]HHZ74133.1 hypothetical protein [Candidatus Poseidoniales archaeon]PXY75559.1 MAG: hypothetical protein CXX81_18085 [Euryarchaeota archaeon]PXY77896.1 MAG: hypothetical protein CXX81_10585 [Euryarchaeota archaeon]PXY79525.1 MAG: hypothetical protein CXX81_02265 [Euryarchaeota archaeon]